MKFIFVLAVAVVAVTGKSLSSDDLAKNSDTIQADVNKEINARILADPQGAASKSITFLMGVDADLRSKIINVSRKTVTRMANTNKTLEERFIEMADLHRDLADLWNQAANKYVEVNNTAGLSDAEKFKILTEYTTKNEDEQSYANRQQLRADLVVFMASIDAGIWGEILKDTGKVFALMLDTSKTLKARYNETAEIYLHTADLWKQAAIKIKATAATDAGVTEASAPLAAQ